MTSTAALRFTLAATHRVVDRVHHHAAHMRPPALPTGPPGLAGGNVHMIDIADLTARGVCVCVDTSNFTRRHLHQGVTAFEVIENGLLAGAAGNLATAAGHELDIVNICA